MMYKNKKGFSLAELLISLLIISIILAAAIPTVTKRNKYDPERTWQWSGQNNSAYFGVGSDQSAVIGYFKVPQYSERKAYYDENVFNLGDLTASHPLRDGNDKDNPAFTTTGDKLNLVKRFPFSENVEYNLRNSHISFYNIRGKNATENDVKYAGRIAADEYNIAFGIGTLASLNAIEYNKVSSNYNTAFKGYNTAIGHYSSILTSSGQYNTALGFAALKNSVDGDNNTAIGVETLSTGTTGKGNDNTAVGAYALKNGNDGNYNTAIGSGACNNLVGNGNVCIGYGAGAQSGTSPKEVNYSLAIGHAEGIDEDAVGKAGNGDSLITGYLEQDEDNNIDKQLNVNARFFRVNPYDGLFPIFTVEANAGKVDPLNPALSEGKGYAHDKARFGKFNFTLRDTGGAYENIQLQLSGDYDGVNKFVKINTVDHRKDVNAIGGITQDSAIAEIRVNDTFTFVSPQKDATDEYARIKVFNPYSTDINDVFLDIADAMLLQPKSASNVAMEMTKDDGFKVERTPSGLSQIIEMSGTSSAPKLEIVNNKSNLTMDKDGINLYSDTNLKITSETSGAISLGGLYIYDDNTGSDIVIPNLTVYSELQGSLVATIKKLKQELDNKQDKGTTSDIRLKNVSGDSTAGLKEINALEVKNYTYKDDKEKTPHVGVIAQQLQKIFPNSVFEGDDGYLRIKTEEIFYAMVNSIKELFAQIQDLTAKVVGLDKRLTQLEKENAMLKKQNADFEKRLSKLEAKMAK